MKGEMFKGISLLFVVLFLLSSSSVLAVAFSGDENSLENIPLQYAAQDDYLSSPSENYRLGKNYEEYIAENSERVTRTYYPYDIGIRDGAIWVPYTYSAALDQVFVRTPVLDFVVSETTSDNIAGVKAEWIVEASHDNVLWTNVSFSDWVLNVNPSDSKLVVKREGTSIYGTLTVAYEYEFLRPTVRAYAVFGATDNVYARLIWSFDNHSKTVLLPFEDDNHQDNFWTTPEYALVDGAVLVSLEEVEAVAPGSTKLMFSPRWIEEGTAVVVDPFLHPTSSLRAWLSYSWDDWSDDESLVGKSFAYHVPGVQPSAQTWAWWKQWGWWGNDWSYGKELGLFSFEVSDYPAGAQIESVRLQFDYSAVPKHMGTGWNFKTDTIKSADLYYLGGHPHSSGWDSTVANWKDSVKYNAEGRWIEDSLPFTWSQATAGESLGITLTPPQSGSLSTNAEITNPNVLNVIVPGTSNELVFSLVLNDYHLADDPASQSKYPNDPVHYLDVDQGFDINDWVQWRGPMLQNLRLDVDYFFDRINVAVILAEPADVRHNAAHNRAYYVTNLLNRMRDYYDEVSDGAVTFNWQVFDSGGNWYRLPSNTRTYAADEYLFIRDVLAAADADINYTTFDVVIVVFAGSSNYETGDDVNSIEMLMTWQDFVTTDGAVNNSILVSETALVGSWAHEMGHALGRIIVRDTLPDLYLLGDSDGWDLMMGGYGGATAGTPAGNTPVHLSSYSKEFLGWLQYHNVGIGWQGDIESLSTMSYGDEVYRYRYHHPTLDILAYDILEVRTNQTRYSDWDVEVPGTGLVIYRVIEDIVLIEGIEGTFDWVNVVPNAGDFHTVGDSYSDPLGGVQFTVESQNSGTDAFTMNVAVGHSTTNLIGASILYIPSLNLPKKTYPFIYRGPRPDLDLHAYTADGKHIGMNYGTGTYEVEVPGAFVSGDSKGGIEWIFVPSDVEVYFSTEGEDMAAASESYKISVSYFDGTGNRHDSDLIHGEISTGTSNHYTQEVTQNPDGTYSVVVNIESFVSVDILSPVSLVNIIETYWKNQTPFAISAQASDDLSGVETVSLLYRHSVDGVNWSGWKLYSDDFDAPWEWKFSTSEGDGYYEFYSIATDRSGNVEDAPAAADATVGVDTTPPESSVDSTDEWQSSGTFTVIAIASDATSGVGEVMLFYKHSSNNSTWSDWKLYGVDTEAPWSWEFDSPDSDGYYKFGTLALDVAGNLEQPIVEQKTLTGTFDGEYVHGEEHEHGYSWTSVSISGDGIRGHREGDFYGMDLSIYPSPLTIDQAASVGISLSEPLSFEQVGEGWEPTFNTASVAIINPVRKWNVLVDDVQGTAEAGDVDIRTRWEGNIEYVEWVADYSGEVTAEVRVVLPEATASVAVDTTPPESNVNEIAPSWRSTDDIPFEVTATASDAVSGVDSVELLYRYSADGDDWTEWASAGVDGEEPWSWSFSAPEGDGYYEFTSTATDALGNSGQAAEEFTASVPLTYGRVGGSGNYLGTAELWFESEGFLITGIREDGSVARISVNLEMEELFGMPYAGSMVAEIWLSGGEVIGTLAYGGELPFTLPDGTQVLGISGQIGGAYDGSIGSLTGAIEMRARRTPESPEPQASVLIVQQTVVGEAQSGTVSQGRARHYGLEIPEGTPMIHFGLDWPGSDLDLHVYDPEGGHVGWNYAAGGLDLEIPGAEYSGMSAKPEWVQVWGPHAGFWTVMVYPYEVEEASEFTLETYVDATPPVSSVNLVEPLWHGAAPFDVAATASDDRSGVAEVELFYRFSPDNSSWGHWFPAGVDSEAPWAWSFAAAEGDGYYEFHSVATDGAGNVEGTVFDEEFSVALDGDTWSEGKTGVKLDGISVSGGRLELTARADRSGKYGANYVVSKSPIDFSDGLVFEVRMSVPTYDAPGDFRGEFYLTPASTTDANPHSQPDWIRVAASVNREGVRWMLQRRVNGGGVGTLGEGEEIIESGNDELIDELHMYTSGPTTMLDGTWRIEMDGQNVTVWLNGELVEPTRPHGMNFTSAYLYLAERTKVAPVYTVTFDYLRVQEFAADAAAGVDTAAPESSVDRIEPYWQVETPFAVTATASDALSGVASVELQYRHSFDNSTWGEWATFASDYESPYSWSFDIPAGHGFYEFRSSATDAAGNRESGSEPSKDWLEGWTYRRPITIDSPQELADHQVKIEIDWNRNMRQDYGDLRFTADDGSALLPYWIESSGSISAKAWVRVSSIPSGESTIYVYYGNLEASSASDGDATFLLFDDFEGGALDSAKWTSTSYGGTAAVSDGKVSLRNARIDSRQTFGVDYVCRSSASFEAVPEAWIALGFLGNDGVDMAVVSASVHDTPDFIYSNRKDGNWGNMDSGLPVDSSWRTFQVARDGGTANVFSIDDGHELSNPSQVSTVPMSVFSMESGTGTLKADWVFVKKYSPQEPAASAGEEETRQAPDEADARCATLIPATIDIDPDTLNLKGNGKWVTAYIELLPGFDVLEVRIGTVAIEGDSILQPAVFAESDTKYGFVKNPDIKDRDGDGLEELMAKFDRAAVQEILDAGESVEITVIGRWGEAPFRGSDNIRVTDFTQGSEESQGHGNGPAAPPGQSGESEGPPQTPPGQGGTPPGQSSSQGQGNSGQGNGYRPATPPGQEKKEQANNDQSQGAPQTPPEEASDQNDGGYDASGVPSGQADQPTAQGDQGNEGKRSQLQKKGKVR